ncbi:MAG: hypothetical protein RLZZ53_1212 [Acidobacteriota bacterium]
MVAVVTGGASGIGESMAAEFVRRRLHVVLVDIDTGRLEETRAKLSGGTSRVFTICADLSQDASVQMVRHEVERRVGSPDVLCANAGVYARGGPIWLAQSADWQWVWQVNVMGVVRSLQALVPGMLRQPDPGHIVITSSIMGFTGGQTSIYGTSKHAVTRIAEGLHHDLIAIGAPIGVTLLCPGAIATQLMLSERNRPAHLGGTSEGANGVSEQAPEHQYFQTHGRAPSLVAAAAIDAIEHDQFYAFLDADARPHLETRLADVRETRAPTLVPLITTTGAS